MSADVMCKSCGFSLYVSCRNCNTNAGSIVDRPLLNTKLMLPNSTIVLSMWFIIRSNSFTVWDISLILQKLLHSSMIPGVSSLNLHEYAMADDSTASISFSRHTITCSLVFFHTSIGIRSDHMSYPTVVIQIHVLCYVLWSPLPSMRQRIYVNCVTPFGVAVTGKLALIMDCISHPVLEEP